MSKKSTYRAVGIKSVDEKALVEAAAGAEVVVAVDVAKEAFAAAIAVGERMTIVRFGHPTETRSLLDLLVAIKAKATRVTVLMEPTGTYGDALRHQLGVRELNVAMIQPRHTHGAKEVFDGVPSSHDNKDAVTMIKLHRAGSSRSWKPSDEKRRTLRAMMDRYLSHDAVYEAVLGRIEGVMVRYWPELAQWVTVREHACARALLLEFGGPQAVAKRPAEAAELLRRASHSMLSEASVAGVIDSARTTLGVPMLPADLELLQDLVEQVQHHADVRNKIEKQLEKEVGTDPGLHRLRAKVGPLLAVAIRTYLGPASQYPSSASFLKAAGLNVREDSSGTEQSNIHITKNGPSYVRKLLYLAALRCIDNDPIVRAWYQRRRAWTREQKVSATVAVMRKLLKGLYCVDKHDTEFDSSKLFDVRRLKITPNVPRALFVPRSEPRSIVSGKRRRRGAVRQQGGVAP